MVMATNQGMFTNQSSAPSSGFVYVVGNRTFNTAEEAKQYLARNPGAGTISRIPFQNVTGPTTSGPFNVPTTPELILPPEVQNQLPREEIYQSPPIIAQPGGMLPIPSSAPAPAPQPAPVVVPEPEPAPEPVEVVEEPSVVKNIFPEYFPEPAPTRPREPYIDSGPIIAQPGGTLPIPPATTKTSAPTKQAPIIIPTSDPTKTTKNPYESPPIIVQPGELPTRPFEPTKQVPVSSSDMGININLDIPDIPSDIFEIVSENMFGQYGDRLFPYVYTARNDDLNTGQSRGPLDGLSIEMLSAQDLYARFAQDNYAQKAFGSFENYIGYLDDLLNLAEEHPEIAWWEDKGFRNLTGSNQQVAEFYGLEDEDARSGSGARIDAESANIADANEAFEAMLALPEFRQLVADRGIETQFRLSENDIYVFNGLTATEIHEGADTFGSYFSAAMNIANRLALAYMTGQVGDAGLSSLRNAAELGTLGPYSSSIGRVIDLMNSSQAGAGLEASAILNEVGPLIVNLGDDTQIEDPLAEAEEEPAEESGAFDPLLTGDPGDLFEPDTTLEEDPFEFEVIEPEEQEEPEPDLPIEIEPPTLPEPEEEIETPEETGSAGVTAEEVTDIVNDAISNIPPGMTPEQVSQIVNEAIGNIQFPEEMTPEQVQQIVGAAISEIEFPPSVSQEEVNQIVGNVQQELQEGIASVEQSLQEALEAQAAGQARELTEAEARLLEQITGVEAEVLQQLSTVEGALNTRLNNIGTDISQVQTNLESSIAGVRGEIRDVEASLQDALEAQSQGQTRELTEAEARLLSEITGVEAGLLQQLSTVQGGLNARLQNIGTDLDSVRDELGTSILGVQREVSDVERSLTEALEAATLNQATSLSDAEARLLSQLTGIEADILQQMAASEAGLQQELLDVGTNINQVRADLQSQIQTTQEETARSLEQASDERRQLQDALAAQAAGQARQLTEAEARLLSQITGVEASTLRQLSTVEGALNNQLNQLGTNINNVQNQLEQSIAGIAAGQQTAEQERRDLQQALLAVGGDVNRLDAQTRQQFEEFGEDVNQLFAGVNVDIEGLRAGQVSQEEAFRQYQADAASQAAQATTERRNLQQSLIAVQGDVSQLDANTRRQFEEFGGTVNDLFADVNVDIEGLRQGQVSQQEAQRDFEQSVAGQFGDITGQLGALGGQVSGLMSDVAGIGQGLEGLGEGVAGLGQGLGAGLLGLAAAQPTAQQIAAAMPRQPVKFDPFLKGLSPFQPLTPIALAPQKQTDAMSELNKFIGRQTGMLV